MAGGPDAGRAEIELAGLRLGERDEFTECFRINLGIKHDQHRHVSDDGNRRKCGLRVEWHLGVEELVGRENAGRSHQQRVAIGLGLGDGLGTSVAPAPARFSTMIG